jgi:hypothetical protein
MPLSDHTLEKLDKRLLDIALNNFELFCLIAGVDKERAFICLEKRGGKSVRQIQIATGIPRSTIGSICKKCP